MTRIGFRSILVAALTLTPFQTRAQTNLDHVDSDYLLGISSQYFSDTATRALSAYLTRTQFDLANYSLGSQPTLHLNQIHLSFASQQFAVSGANNQIQFTAEKNQILVELGDVSVNEVITKNLNGININIAVNASCTGFAIAINDPNSIISATLTPEVHGDLVGFQVTAPVLHLGHPVLQASSLHCQGASGFDLLIADTLQKELQNPTGLNQYIQQQVIANLDNFVQQVVYNWRQPQKLLTTEVVQNGVSLPLDLWTYPSDFTLRQDGAWISQGTLRLILPWTMRQPVEPIHFTKPVQNLALKDSAALIFPDSAVPAMVKAYLAPGQWNLPGKANDIGAFQFLLNCNLFNFFIWPDLRHWARSAIFNYNAFLPSVANVGWTNSSPNDLSLNLAAPILVDMTANQTPYLKLSAQVQSTLAPGVENGLFSFTTDNNKLNVNYKWAPTCGDGGDCGFIATWLILPFVEKFLNGRQFDFPLPKIVLAPTVVLQANQVSRDQTEGTVTFNFGSGLTPAATTSSE